MKFAWLCSHEWHQPEVLVHHALAAERAGFDAVLASDRFHPWVDDVAAAGHIWSWLGAVSVQTTIIELATSVTCPLFRTHPAVIAQAAATLDRLSQGRFRLGVGTGDGINDAPLGWQRISRHERLARLGEALTIMRALWAGEKLSFQGQWYHVDRAHLYSPPLALMQVWMAADGPRAAAFAGRHADGLLTSVKDLTRTHERVVAPMRAAAAAAGRRVPSLIVTRWCVFANDPDEAWEALAAMWGLRTPNRDAAVDPTELRQQADAMHRAHILSHYPWAKNAADLVEVYRPLITDLHADYVSIQIASVDPLATMELVRTEVLPYLRALAGAA